MSPDVRAARTARVEAQAKLNLFLRVLSREPSGYHQLETLFQRIALADSVTVSSGGAGRSLDCRGADVGPVERNLAWRAALAYAEAAGGPAAFRIEIDKRIPVGGGLGGGSADAAAVLRALNALAQRPLDDRALDAIAFSLGADVPYLLSTHALALGSGRGERLHALEALPSRDVLLAIPPFGVSSGDAFRWHAEQNAARKPGTLAMLPVGRKIEWRTIAALAANDLEHAVIAHHPEIGALRDAMRQSGAILAQMSGSGSTVFGVFDSSLAGRSFPVLDTLGARAIRTSTLERVASVELDP
ncbi:MAG: 4-(cytidine 5'-diphospho)-2-C-methyl-D-erythritol kinase [Gemmatimonadales bacterium]